MVAARLPVPLQLAPLAFQLVESALAGDLPIAQAVRLRRQLLFDGGEGGDLGFESFDLAAPLPA